MQRSVKVRKAMRYFYFRPKLCVVFYFCTRFSPRKKSPYSELFWSAFFPCFPAFWQNTERYFVPLRIQSKCGKNVDQKNSEYGLFMQCLRSRLIHFSPVLHFIQIPVKCLISMWNSLLGWKRLTFSCLVEKQATPFIKK